MRHKALYPVSLVLAFALGWVACAYGDRRIAVRDDVPTVYFSPGGGSRAAILEQIRGAREEIIAVLYYFTDQGLADALSESNRAGVAISVLLDKSQRKGKYSQAQRLTDSGIAVMFDVRHRILHHKFMVVDGEVLITGSQNWTKSAETANAENTLIIANSPVLAGRYRNEFYRLWELAEP